MGDNWTKTYRNKQDKAGLMHVNPLVRSDNDRDKVIAEAKRMRVADGHKTIDIVVAERSGPATYPKRVRVWVPKHSTGDMLAFAKKLRDNFLLV